MNCDRCRELVPENINGAVRVKLGAAEYVFHLCLSCQQLFAESLADYHSNRAKVAPKRRV